MSQITENHGFANYSNAIVTHNFRYADVDRLLRNETLRILLFNSPMTCTIGKFRTKVHKTALI